MKKKTVIPPDHKNKPGSAPKNDKREKKEKNTSGNGGDEFRLIREILESLAIALVLAFLVKTFLIELFVIPTGSMAPTLMGLHKDLNCPVCGAPFQISASEERPDLTGHGSIDKNNPTAVVGGTCPQCRSTSYLGKNNPQGKNYRRYAGDRILVSKYDFAFRQPKRWHVTVFRYPAKPQISYIKRLIGLENETVRIRNGDIFVKREGETKFTIQRKPSRALNAVLQPVDDIDYPVEEWQRLGWPNRWADAGPDYKSFSVWVFDPENKSYHGGGSRSPEQVDWLLYRNIIPGSGDCLMLRQGELPQTAASIQPELITDFTPYNAGLVNNPVDRRRDASEFVTAWETAKDGKLEKQVLCRRDPLLGGLNWVGDLALSCEFDLFKAGFREGHDPNIYMRLVKGGQAFLCSIDVKTGEATLRIPGIEAFRPTKGQTPVKTGSSFHLQFSNIDEEMRLWVNGKEIAFDGPATYDHLCEGEKAPLPRDRSPTVLDLEPAAIGSSLHAVIVRHLQVKRDLYYIAMDQHNQRSIDYGCDLLYSPFIGRPMTEEKVHDILSNPVHWVPFGKTRSVEFVLGKDQFLMLGDNSAKSKDSRLWTEDGIPAHVPRDLLVGEALFVYWPHGFPIPGIPLNPIPNFSKMRLID